MASANTKVTLYSLNDKGEPQNEFIELRQVDRRAAEILVRGGTQISVKQPGWLKPRPFEPSVFEVLDALKRFARYSGLDKLATVRWMIVNKHDVPEWLRNDPDVVFSIPPGRLAPTPSQP